MVPLFPPFPLCHRFLTSSLSICLFSAPLLLFLPPFSACLSHSHTHTLAEVSFFYILDTARGRCRENDRRLHVSLGFTRRGNLCTPTPSPLTCLPIQCLENPLSFPHSPLSCGLGSPSSRKASLIDAPQAFSAHPQALALSRWGGAERNPSLGLHSLDAWGRNS